MTEAIGGYVGDAAGVASSATITRTNDTNAYTAGDVIGAATGSTAAISFAVAGRVGGECIITGASLECDSASVISGENGYTLQLYSATPPSALGDNAAWDLPSGDRGVWIGQISLGQPVDLGSTLYVESNGFIKQITVPTDKTIYAYLMTVGGFTPAASTVRKITLHSVPA